MNEIIFHFCKIVVKLGRTTHKIDMSPMQTVLDNSFKYFMDALQQYIVL